MSDQINAIRDLIAAVQKTIRDLSGKGPEFDAVRKRFKATLIKLEGMLALLELNNQEAETGQGSLS